MPDCAAQPVERNGVSRRDDCRREIGLDAMCYRIQAGRRSQPRRQSQRKFWIANSDFGQKMRTEQSKFQSRIHHDQTSAPHFAASARRGRNGNHRRNSGRDLTHTALDDRILLKRRRVRCKQCSCLPKVNRRSAADSDNSVAAIFSKDISRSKNGVFRRIRRCLIEDKRF